MYILGIHGSFGRAEHDAAAVLIKDNEIVAAAEEERFVRYKHAVGLMPDRAIQYCLEQGNITMQDIDIIAFPRATWDDFPPRFEAYLWYNYGYVPSIEYVDHHTSHAASSYFISGFDSALVVTIDQAGDGVSCAAYKGTGRNNLELLESIPFPHSVGLFAAYMTQYLGFRSNHDEYKVMGLSSYGKPRYNLSKLMTTKKGVPLLNTDLLHPEVMRRHPIFHTDQLPMYKDEQYDFMPDRRLRTDTLKNEHKDLAASAQKTIEDTIDKFISKHNKDNRLLCLAGGVIENSVSNGKLAASKIFKDIYVGPACGDAGTALGAALYVATKNGFVFDRLEDNKLGPQYDDSYIQNMLESCEVDYRKSENIVKDTAQLLADQNIIAWFQGRMEFGPRALGSRSLIADPSKDQMRKRVNKIKKREQFRPFAPSVLEEYADELFTVNQKSPFMSFTLETTNTGKRKLAAATHIDFTGRLQTVSRDNSRYRELIEEFNKLTGVPAILNTSLNSGWEPIVESPDQALAFFFSCEADVLVLNEYIVSKK